jgi:hypothetical protein
MTKTRACSVVIDLDGDGNEKNVRAEFHRWVSRKGVLVRPNGMEFPTQEVFALVELRGETWGKVVEVLPEFVTFTEEA